MEVQDEGIGVQKENITYEDHPVIGLQKTELIPKLNFVAV